MTRFMYIRVVTIGYFQRKHSQKAGKLVYVNNIISFCTAGRFDKAP
jgi:hypothetical protein